MHYPEEPAGEWLEFLDHAADVGIRVKGCTLPEIFTRAAWGMFALVAEVEEVRPTTVFNCSVQAQDPGALLVRWLSELNCLHQIHGYLFSRFEVKEVGECQLDCRAWGEPMDPLRHGLRLEIKAVTFCDLAFINTGDGFQAQVVFDV